MFQDREEAGRELAQRRRTCLAFMLLMGFGLLPSGNARAHCDTLDGPVVKDAQAALKTKDVTSTLKWVKAENEAEVRTAFKKTLAVRSKGREAEELADTYFFETLVRLHRASEGEPFTGLKPAGAADETILEVDRALETGSADFLIGHLTAETETSLLRRFLETLEKRKEKDDSVYAGREYVAAYVSFLHYLERLTANISGTPVHQEKLEDPEMEHRRLKVQEGE